jgi:hypothetical protein
MQLLYAGSRSGNSSSSSSSNRRSSRHTCILPSLPPEAALLPAKHNWVWAFAWHRPVGQSGTMCRPVDCQLWASLHHKSGPVEDRGWDPWGTRYGRFGDQDWASCKAMSVEDHVWACRRLIGANCTQQPAVLWASGHWAVPLAGCSMCKATQCQGTSVTWQLQQQWSLGVKHAACRLRIINECKVCTSGSRCCRGSG